MAESAPPSKHDIQAIFKKLRSQQTNKQCFDCNSTNPTWASVTYGVFLCIDCSATHRSLGVHLTFIRSTQLDTNWTWVQLRAMQCGGNANATAFFRQHGCSTKDAQQKYNSRAAALYKEKLHQAALHAQRLYGEKVHIDLSDTPASPSADKKEEDFFSNHTSSFSSAGEPRGSPLPDRTGGTPPRVDSASRIAGTPPRVNSTSRIDSQTNGGSSGNLNVNVEDGGQPSVEAALVSPKQTEPRKSTIGARKPAPKKGLGGKGLGATRVKTNFSDIESQIHRQEKEREEEVKQMAIQEVRNNEEAEKQLANMRLAYKDIAADKKRHEDRLRTMDPKKAEQAERLGMGYGKSRGASHSAMSDMTVITQETPSTRSTQSDVALGRKPASKIDDWEKVDAPSTSLYDDLGRRREPAPASSSSGWGSWDTPTNSWGQSSDVDKDTSSSFFSDEMMSSKPKDDRRTERSRKPKPAPTTERSTDEALHSKFVNAKSISSSQVFGEDRGASQSGNAGKFSGSSSISSDDYFGSGAGQGAPSSSYSGSLQTPDIQDIRDGVKQGVSKVAGKLSSLASGVMSSMQ